MRAVHAAHVLDEEVFAVEVVVGSADAGITGVS